MRFLAETHQPDLAAVTTATLHDFQRWHLYYSSPHAARRGASRTRTGLAAIKGLFKFLHEENIIARDPAHALEYGREPQTLPRNILTPQEARRIIEALDVQTVLGYRDRVVLEVLYATGIRKLGS